MCRRVVNTGVLASSVYTNPGEESGEAEFCVHANIGSGDRKPSLDELTASSRIENNSALGSALILPAVEITWRALRPIHRTSAHWNDTDPRIGTAGRGTDGSSNDVVIGTYVAIR